MNISKMVRDIKKCQQTDPPKTYPFYVYLGCVSYLIFIIWRFGRDFNIQKRRKMVNLRTEEQNHGYLKNGKRYQKITANRPPPPKNMPILRLSKLCFMPYLHNLAIQQGFQYPKRRKMVDLRRFYFQSKKSAKFYTRMCSYEYILKTTSYEVSKKVQHTPYLLKTAQKNIFQIQHFRANFRYKAKKTKSKNHHLEMTDRINFFPDFLYLHV